MYFQKKQINAILAISIVTMSHHQQPETAGHEAPDDDIAAAGSKSAMSPSTGASTAADRLNALVLSTPRGAGSSSGLVVAGSSGTRGGARSTTTPLSSAKASRSAAVVGEGFEELMKERARVS